VINVSPDWIKSKFIITDSLANASAVTIEMYNQTDFTQILAGVTWQDAVVSHSNDDATDIWYDRSNPAFF